MSVIDARGLACPRPVLLAKEAIKACAEQENVQVLVDNAIAVENLTKMAQHMGCTAQSEAQGTDFSVVITVGAAAPECTDSTELVRCAPTGKTVVVLSSDTMGSGNDELGRALMKGFVFALTQLDSYPDTVLLYNGGARLSSQVPETIADLKKLEQEGTEILTCGTCLNFYGLTEALAVGGATNMYAICETMAQAGKVIRP